MPDQNQTAQKILMLATSYVLMEESNNELYHQSDIEDLTWVVISNEIYETSLLYMIAFAGFTNAHIGLSHVLHTAWQYWVPLGHCFC